MKFFSFRSAGAATLLAALGAVLGCGDDESSATGGGGGGTPSATSSTSSSGSTSSSSVSTSTGQGGGGVGGGGTGGDGTGGAGVGGSGTGGSGAGGDGAGGKGDGGGGGGSGICLPTATTVDLAEVVERATTLVTEEFGEGIGEPTVWFQDGLNAVGFSAPNDMGAIVVAFEPPAGLEVFDGERITYRATIWGEENVWLGRVVDFEGLAWDVDVPPGDEYFNYFTAHSGLGGLAGDVSDAAADALAQDFETEFPGSSFSVFADLGVYTFVGVDADRLAEAFAFLEGRDEVDYVEPDGEVYATDFGFGPRVSLADELDDGPIDVYEEHAFLSHWLREQGIYTYDLPTLPAPHGPGPLAQSPTQRYEIGFAEGSDVAACIDELETCGFGTETDGDVVYLIDPSYVAAAALRNDACVAYLIPELGDGPV